MSLVSRVLAVSLLLVLLPLHPAAAAATTATAEPRLSRVTLAPGGPERGSLLWVHTDNVEPYADQRLEVTVELGAAAAFTETDLVSMVNSNTIELVVAGVPSAPPRPPSPCVRTGTKFACSWTTSYNAAKSVDVAAVLLVKPTAAAKTGDSAEVTVTARLGDGPIGTSTSIVQVGVGVDLVAGQTPKVKAAPGKTVKVVPAVRNNSATTATGVTLFIDADARLLAPTSYRNCRYGLVMICTFDTALAAGRTYALARPLLLRSPADTVPGSATEVIHGWATKDEWEDESLGDQIGTPGTGAPLTLTPVASAQAEPPQADVNPENNYAVTKFTVAGKGFPVLSAIGSARESAVGSELQLSPGLMNFGPGTLRPTLFTNNALPVAVRLPANVTSAGSDDCVSDSDDVYYCSLQRDLGPGQRATFAFAAEVTDGCGDPGKVSVPDRLVTADYNPRTKHTATLSVTVAGATCVALPITGPRAAWTALAGLALVTAGLVLALRRTRRAVCAHAEGASSAGSPLEGQAR
ncbi:hypothetical protein KOI35_41885 [Actinoplanes bogorensis]|uniref:DUF11 domain-containing protein n=1 Tax=Paractinoplanes bogorensis TaxID=1610840 RepID=A0ABS5Z304_9ACTN|nr:hypothetical protein [Actinoplanes bogorensis]MBU2670077.1 hypothetical protein [Actinoplanes bogorensis]